MTLDSLIKKYGSMEDVIRRFLQGELENHHEFEAVRQKVNPASIARVSHTMVMEALKKQEKLLWLIINHK